MNRHSFKFFFSVIFSMKIKEKMLYLIFSNFFKPARIVRKKKKINQPKVLWLYFVKKTHLWKKNVQRERERERKRKEKQTIKLLSFAVKNNL